MAYENGLEKDLGNRGKDSQRFNDAIVSIFALDWSKGLPNSRNVTETFFKCGLLTLNNARFC